jgi:hypothetical protein
MQSPVPITEAAFGDTVLFGTYPQAADGSDKTPIAWRVLHSSPDELFLLSHYILDCNRYHGEDVSTQWRDCDLRRWLNGTFYDAAFSAREKECIHTTRCSDNGNGKADTKDKVFLLSLAEIQKFTDTKDGTETTIMRRTTSTDWAKTTMPDGCRLYVYDKGIEKDYVTEGGRKLGCSWWWTRTQSQDEHPDRATFIGARSNIKRYGQVTVKGCGVRPAIRLR